MAEAGRGALSYTLERFGKACVDLIEEFGYFLALTL